MQAAVDEARRRQFAAGNRSRPAPLDPPQPPADQARLPLDFFMGSADQVGVQNVGVAGGSGGRTFPFAGSSDLRSSALPGVSAASLQAAAMFADQNMLRDAAGPLHASSYPLPGPPVHLPLSSMSDPLTSISAMGSRTNGGHLPVELMDFIVAQHHFQLQQQMHATQLLQEQPSLQSPHPPLPPAPGPPSASPASLVPPAHVVGSEGPPMRKRVANACDPCFQRKARCDGEAPCQRCVRLRIPCERTRIRKKPGPPPGYSVKRQKGTEASSSDLAGLRSPSAKSSSSLADGVSISIGRERGLSPYGLDGSLMRPSDAQAKEMVQAFFKKTYYMSFPFLHKPTFLATIHSQPLYLQFAMFANAARFSSDGTISHKPRTASLHFYEHAKSLLEPLMLRTETLSQMELVSVVQTLILLMNYASWAGAAPLAQRFIGLAVTVAKTNFMNREVSQLIKDARRGRRALLSGDPDMQLRSLMNESISSIAENSLISMSSDEDLAVYSRADDPVIELSKLSPLDIEIRRRTWFVTFFCACAWGLGTNGVPLVTAADSQLSVPMNEGGFLALSPTEAPFAGCSPSMSLPSPGSEAVQLHGGESLTMPSRIAFGWPDLDDASRMTVLETFVSNPGTLVASGGNLALMSQAFGLVARVINVKQEARAHDIAGPFDPHCTPWILSQFRRVEAAMDEWWAALPPDMIRGPAWDALATSDNEYSEVVPGVLIVFLMARIQLRSPDDVDVGAGEQGDDQAVLAAKRAWISSPWFLKCAQDARTMAGILRKLYIRNPEALDFMKGVVVKGVYVAGAVLLVVLEQLQAQDEPQLRHAIVRDVKSCVQSLRGVEHGVKAAGQLADLLERGLKPYQVDV